MRRWTSKEIRILRKIYPKEGASSRLQKELNKSRKAIHCKASRLGLRNISSWTVKDIKMMKDRYPVEGASPELQKDLNRARSTIRWKAKQLGLKANLSSVQSHAQRKLSSRIQFSDGLKNSLEGLLLGDGSLVEMVPNYSVCLRVWSKFPNYLRQLRENLEELGLSFTTKIAIRDKIPTPIYTLQSRNSPDLYFLYQLWYDSEGKKIPKDFKISPESLLQWYLGDGGYYHGNEITITNSVFHNRGLEDIIIPQLKDLFNINVRSQNCRSCRNGIVYYLCIPLENQKKFFEYIGECEYPDYRYKWGGDELLKS